MWTLHAEKIVAHLKSSTSGEPLLRLVKTLLMTDCWKHGRPTSELKFTDAINLGDGGVDGITSNPVGPNDAPLVPMQCVWQLKTGPLTPGRIRNEILKTDQSKTHRKSGEVRSRVKEKLLEGYGYVLVSGASVNSPDMLDLKPELESCLKELVADEAPDFKVPFIEIMFAEQLAMWAVQYPNVVMQVDHQEVSHHLLHLDTWGKPLEAEVPTFVDVDGWASALEQIRQHALLKKSADEAVLAILGDPGVGKSRLVYEALRQDDQLRNLVVCLEDASGLQHTINYLRNHPHLSTILVVEKCTLSDIRLLTRQLRGLQNRIRCFALGVIGPGQGVPPNSIKLPCAQHEEIQQVLGQIAPDMPKESVSDLAERISGQMHLAVATGRHHQKHPHSPVKGRLTFAHSEIERLLESLLSETQIQILKALSLVDQLGIQGPDADEVNQLADFLHMSAADLRLVLMQLATSTPWVEFKEGHVRVPQKWLAEHLFDQAWKRWGPSPAEFLGVFPLQAGFLRRVLGSAPGELKPQVAACFRKWVQDLAPEDLKDREALRRMFVLLYMDPADMLPRLERSLEKPRFVGWATHLDPYYTRELVDYLIWALRQHIRDQRLFDACTQILSRLVMLEKATDSEGEATFMWRQLFVRFGAAVMPLRFRLKGLEVRLNGFDIEQQHLAASTLCLLVNSGLPDRLVNQHDASQTDRSGLPLPTRAEQREAVATGWALLLEAAHNHPNASIQQACRQGLFEGLVRGIGEGFHDTILPTLTSLHLNLPERQQGSVRIKLMLARPEKLNEKTKQSLQALLDLWTAKGILEELEWFSCGGDLEYTSKERQKMLEGLARQAFLPETFEATLATLVKLESYAVIQWGKMLGGKQGSERHLLRLWDLQLKQAKACWFILAYLESFLEKNHEHDQWLQTQWSQLQETNPQLAFDLSRHWPSRLEGQKKGRQLIQEGKVDPQHLERIWVLGHEPLQQLLDGAKQLIQTPVPGAVRNLLDAFLNRWEKDALAVELQMQEVQVVLKELLGLRECHKDNNWAKTVGILERMVPEARVWVIEVLLKHVLDEPTTLAFLESDHLLRKTLVDKPDITLDILVQVLQDPTLKNTGTPLILDLLPWEAWLLTQETQKVIILAGFLPRPLWHEDNMVVPDATERLLWKFKDEADVHLAYARWHPEGEMQWNPAPIELERLCRALRFHPLMGLREWSRRQEHHLDG